MSELKVTLAQAATAIQAVGASNTIMLQGQPGIGKSAILQTLAKQLPEYYCTYVDVTTLDLGDTAMPVVDRDQMVTNYAPNARFGLGRQQSKPVLIMLDELPKASRPVLNMLLPLMLEHRLGDRVLPAGSIVCGTGNLASDGVGDNIPAHAYNRMTVVRVQNPSADDWIKDWAIPAGLATEVLAFAKQFPTAFHCYADLGAEERNPYIFDPRVGNVKAFCSPRSLTKASHLVRARDRLGDSLLPFLAGTIGEAAARDMEALINLSDQLPAYADVVANPKTCKLPSGAGAYFIMAFMLAGRISKDDANQVLDYIDRWDNFEAKTLSIVTMANHKAAELYSKGSTGFVERCRDLGKYF